MQYIQYSIDKKKLSTFVENNVHFTKMDRNAAMLLNECTKSGLKFKKSRECVNMCKAIKEIRQEEYEVRRIMGQEEGKKRAQERTSDLNEKHGNFSETGNGSFRNTRK